MYLVGLVWPAGLVSRAPPRRLRKKRGFFFLFSFSVTASSTRLDIRIIRWMSEHVGDALISGFSCVCRHVSLKKTVGLWGWRRVSAAVWLAAL